MKKIRILLADDNQESAEAILLSALPCEPGHGFSRKQRLAAIRDVLDIHEFRTVAAAEQYLSKHPENPFHLAFVDINFSATADEDPAPNPALRGLDLIRLLRSRFPDTVVKVHTRHPSVRIIQQILSHRGMSAEDLYDVVEDQDFLLLRGDGSLADDFPRLLRAISRRIWFSHVEAGTRRRTEREISNAINNMHFDHPVPSLDNFLLKSLLAGWSRLEADDTEKPVIVCPENGAQIIAALRKLREELTPEYTLAGNLRKHDAQGRDNLGFLRMEALRHDQEIYPGLLNAIEAATLNLVTTFRLNWAGLDMAAFVNDPDNRNFPEKIPGLVTPLDEDLGAIKHENTSPETVHDTLFRLLVARRIVITLTILQTLGRGIPNCPAIIDLTILALIRNNPEEAIRHWAFPWQPADYQTENPYDNRDVTIRQVFNIHLGLKKITREQQIVLECLLPEEIDWIRNIEENLETLIK